VKWYRLAAEQGDAEVQLNLGVKYSVGDGVRQSCLDAAKLFRRAADTGVAQAQYIYGIMHLNGNGILKNRAIANINKRKELT
jgi:TPR repeat protein